jgi:c(7)-type cytochrome triheme protein
MTGRGVARLVVALAVVLSGVALADLPRLPKDLSMARGADSPGQVIFRHENHVDSAKPDCVTCHPRRFSILGRSRTEERPAITHDAMKKGQACGACHGQAAFGFDDCTSCHAQ